MTARKRIIRVSPLSVAKVMALVYGVLGLIGALFFAVAIMARVRNDFSMAFVVFAPFLYALGGFIGGLIMGAVYNMVAGAVGGIVIDLADEQPWE